MYAGEKNKNMFTVQIMNFRSQCIAVKYISGKAPKFN